MISFSEASTILLVWGVVAHLFADWLTQNEWIALNKMKRRERRKWVGSGWSAETRVVVTTKWWDRHPSLYVHGLAHVLVQLLVFPWPVACAIGAVHMFIDTKEPVVGWSRLIHQTTPDQTPCPPSYLSVGQAVTIAADQVWHIVVIALAALLVG